MSDLLYRALSSKVATCQAKGQLSNVKYVWTKSKQDEFQRMTIEELLNDPYFLGERTKYLFPAHRDDIIELWYRRKEQNVYIFADNTGIGGGKTYKAGAIIFLLSLEVLTNSDFFQQFQLDPASRTAVICSSRDAKKAKEVTFQTLLPFFDCGFINDYFRPMITKEDTEKVKRLPSVLHFPGNFSIFPGTGQEASALGYNVYGSIMDEVNYMTLVSESKRSRSGRIYDAAAEIFDAIKSRMKSRFMIGGKQRGLMVLLSNPRYPGDFMEKLRIESRRDTSIMFKSRTTWKAHPVGRHSLETFKFSVNNLTVLDSDQTIDGRVEAIPMDYYEEAKSNPTDFWRRFGDTPIQSITPYFANSINVDMAINRKRVNPVDEMLNQLKTNFKCEDNFPRFIHVDLGVTSDAACLCMCHADGVRSTMLPNKEVSRDLTLNVVVDVLLLLDPKKLGVAIDFKAIREFIYELTERGFPISLVTFDRFQSVDSIARLRERGYIVENLSIDRTSHAITLTAHKDEGYERKSTGKQYTAAMDCLLSLVNLHAIDIPFHYWDADNEWTQFQYEAKSSERIDMGQSGIKIVPAIGSSDDLLQVVAGAAFNCVNNVNPSEFEKHDVWLQPLKKFQYSDTYSKMDKGVDKPDDDPDFDYCVDRVGTKGLDSILGETKSEFDF